MTLNRSAHRWECDGDGCDVVCPGANLPLPPEWYEAEVAGRTKHYCPSCLDRIGAYIRRMEVA